MRNFLRNHGKKILAVLGIVLMISFIQPSRSTPQSERAATVGLIDGEAVSKNELDSAKAEWGLLTTQVAIGSRGADGQMQFVPLSRVFELSQNPALRQFYAGVSQRPETYYLLWREAMKMGVVVNNSQAERVLDYPWFVMLADGRVIDQQTLADKDLGKVVRSSVARLNQILAAFVRVQSTVKLSEPLMQTEFVFQSQSMNVRLVEFAAKDFVQQVTPPTADELQKHFEKFADSDSGPTSEQNLFGFGYRLPSKVAVQYISVPDSEVRKLVRAGKSEHDWEVEAYRFYYKNLSKYPSTLPASTVPTMGPSSAPATTTRPTTRPFEDVRVLVMDELLQPEVKKKSREVQDAIDSRLAADYRTYRQKNPTTGPTTMFAADVINDTFASYEYLKSVAADVQTKTGVLPTIGETGDLKTVEELGKLPGIGEALIGFVSFADYAINQSAPDPLSSSRAKVVSLAPLEPSMLLRRENDSFTFRVVRAAAAHRPESMTEVAAAVEADLRTVKAHEFAEAAAKKLLQASSTDGLESAAKTAGLTIHWTGEFNRGSSTELPSYSVAPESLQRFKSELGKLVTLSGSTTQPSGPIQRVVSLSKDGKVFVAELATLGAPPPDPLRTMLMSQETRRRLYTELTNDLGIIWFNPRNVATRLKWEDKEKQRDDAEQ